MWRVDKYKLLSGKILMSAYTKLYSDKCMFIPPELRHSTAALNNFDLIPFGTLDRGEDFPIKSDSLVSNTINSTSEIGFKTHQAANPIVAHAKLWDSDRLSTLIKPRAVPKAVSEAAAYNLR